MSNDSAPKSTAAHTTDMGLKKQCIVCNHLMPSCVRVCACGRVAGPDKEMIEEKRCSGYRDEIYSRLEIRRILYENVKNRNIKRHRKSGDKKEIVTKTRTKRGRRNPRNSSSRLISSVRTVSKEHERSEMMWKHFSKGDLDFGKKEGELWPSPTQLDLSAALAGINKRLSNQSMFWINLSTN